MPDEDTVRDALRRVEDPEAGMNIVDLGLIYAISITAGAIHVDMTMTTAACPMADMITEQAKAAVASTVPDGTEVRVQLVWEPPWTPERMTGVAREHFGWNR
jgi:metal-sulfur cluster biosynthetic enzyme